MWPDLSRRNHQVELMDAPGLDPGSHRRALRGLDRINWFSRSADIVWKPIHSLIATAPKRTWRVLDVASGGGGVALALARLAKSTQLNIDVRGVDVSATATEHAEENARSTGFSNVTFQQLDVLRNPLPDDYDVVMCSLFLHHLTSDEAISLLRSMAHAARRLVLVNDLRRTRLGYALAWWGGRMLSRSPIVHADGPMSVAAAFKAEEALDMAEEAGLKGAAIVPRWPQRFLLSWSRP